MQAECSAGVNLQPLTCALWGTKCRELQSQDLLLHAPFSPLVQPPKLFSNEYLYSFFAILLEFLNLLKLNQRENG